jgi:adenylate kinase family enzyme
LAAGLKPHIHILGGPGSGKSYAAAKLAAHFDVPACDLDELFWDSRAPGYGVRADSAARDRQLADIISRDGWIIEGVYYQWLGPSFKAADLIIVMTPSIWIRHWRVIRRFILRRLGRIPSKHETLADLWHLLRWSHAYDTKNLVEARQSITGLGLELVDCRTAEDVMAIVKSRLA